MRNMGQPRWGRERAHGDQLLQQKKRTSLRAVSSRRPLDAWTLVCAPQMPLGHASLHFPKSPQARPGPSSSVPSEQRKRTLFAPVLSPRVLGASTRSEKATRKPPRGHHCGSLHAPHLRGKGRLAGCGGALHPPPARPSPGGTSQAWG